MSGLWGGLWSPPQFESENAALTWCRREFGDAEVEAQALSPIDHALHALRFAAESAAGAMRRQQLAVHDGDDRLWYRLDARRASDCRSPSCKLFERLRIGEAA